MDYLLVVKIFLLYQVATSGANPDYTSMQIQPLSLTELYFYQKIR
jgi:hypothetical protein